MKLLSENLKVGLEWELEGYLPVDLFITFRKVTTLVGIQCWAKTINKDRVLIKFGQFNWNLLCDMRRENNGCNFQYIEDKQGVKREIRGLNSLEREDTDIVLETRKELLKYT